MKKLSQEIHHLDKEIFEKKLKKMDSKYIVQYSEVFLHLDYLFLASPSKSDEIENLYYSIQESKSNEIMEQFPEKSRKTSPKKKRNTEDFSIMSRDEIHNLSKEDQVSKIILF